MALAQRHSGVNYLGVDVRANVIAEARYDAAHLGLAARSEGASLDRDVQDGRHHNVHFATANASFAVDALLGSLSAVSRIATVSILHPDPWFKRRHHKRRLVTPPFLIALARHVPDGCRIVAQTDVEDLHHAMARAFRDANVAPLYTGDSSDGVHVSQLPQPLLSRGNAADVDAAIQSQAAFGEATSREHSVLRQGGTVWRLEYKRSNREVGDGVDEAREHHSRLPDGASAMQGRARPPAR